MSDTNPKKGGGIFGIFQKKDKLSTVATDTDTLIPMPTQKWINFRRTTNGDNNVVVYTDVLEIKDYGVEMREIVFLERKPQPGSPDIVKDAVSISTHFITGVKLKYKAGKVNLVKI